MLEVQTILRSQRYSTNCFSMDLRVVMFGQGAVLGPLLIKRITDIKIPKSCFFPSSIHFPNHCLSFNIQLCKSSQENMYQIPVQLNMISILICKHLKSDTVAMVCNKNRVSFRNDLVHRFLYQLKILMQ